MRLPGATDYMEALQDPSTCFADPELAAGTPALGPLGLPRAISGNVATVFRVDSPGGRSWAVRCFVRPVDEQRRRYDAIAAHLGRLESTWRVGFDLQPCGIRVGGEWWPVVKMAWTPGASLLSYVARHLWDGTALAYLALRFAALTAQLREDGVAHGDLQHGNILVVPGGDLRLVDYDGMYVPALAGLPGTERGHRNYQHPGREIGDLGPGLDHFSSWVIYGSLAALSVDPLLWGRLDGGEEALLLRHHDLSSPDRSPALAALEASEAPGVPALAGLLRSFLAGRAGEVPPLSTGLAALPALALPGAPASPPDGPPAPAGAPLAAPAAGDLARRRSLYDALQGSEVRPPPRPAAGPVRFAGDLSGARTSLAATGVAMVLVVVLAALVAGAGAALVGACATAGAGLGRLRQLYRRTPEAADARRTEQVLARPRQAAAAAAARVGQLTRRRDQVAGEEADAARRAERARAELRGREERESRAVEAALEVELAALAERERATFRAEQDARARALAELQAGVLASQLGRHSLVAASAGGVSPVLVDRLARSGVRTAADFTTVAVEQGGAVVVRPGGRRLEVSGLEPHQAAAMTTWRRHVEESVQVKLPTALPPERVAAIRADHDRLRAGLAAEADAARAEARRRAGAIAARWQEEHDQVIV
ncbi:MAG: hypothetical protein ACT4PX_03290, partial [Actinomycetota bacterium]